MRHAARGFLVLFLLVLIGGCGTRRAPSPDVSRASVTTREASLNRPRLADRASLYVFSLRTFHHDPPPVTLAVDGDTLGTLDDNQYFRLALTPGTHELAVTSCPRAYRCRPRTLQLAAGEARYVKVHEVRRWGALAPVAALFDTVGSLRIRSVASSRGEKLALNNILMTARRHSFHLGMID